MSSNLVNRVSAAFQIPIAELAQRLGTSPDSLVQPLRGSVDRSVLRRVRVLAQTAELMLEYVEAEDLPGWARTPLPGVDNLNLAEAISAGREQQVFEGVRSGLVF